MSDITLFYKMPETVIFLRSKRACELICWGKKMSLI